ncbi:MAG: SpoVT / AbrB like protein [Dehalococcoidia bacterium]|nr:SpoVT / AbrB like protein [Dehalococcoidia bacterium]
MEGQTTTVTSKGQVTIPGEIRKALNIKPKDRVAFELLDGEVRLRPVHSRLLAGYGAVIPKARPEDFRKMRQEVEEEWGEEAGTEA